MSPAEQAEALRRHADTLELGVEPPVVARCVVEVRSDGTLSIARGVFELDNERVSLEGRGSTPQELLSMLARGALTQARERIQSTIRGLEEKLLGGGSDPEKSRLPGGDS